MRKIAAFALLLMAFTVASVANAQTRKDSSLSRLGPWFFAAADYSSPSSIVAQGFACAPTSSTNPACSAGATSGTITVSNATWGLADGRVIAPFFIPPGSSATTVSIQVDQGLATQETVNATPSGCTGPSNFGSNPSCSLTATFTYPHGRGSVVNSGTFGLQEAIYDAQFNGGGMVVIAPGWSGTTATIYGAVAVPGVAIQDSRFGIPQYWTAVGGATTLAAPTTLVAATAGFAVNGANANGAGTYTGSSSYITCIAYVDIMGQEGPCSATFTVATSGSATTNQIGYTAPAASTGAVGYTIYISLAGGTYSLSYKVPLVTQPTAIGAYPAGNGVCTLTTIETITPACSMSSGAVVSALTLNTSPIAPESTVISTTSVYVPNAGGRTTYAFAPGATFGATFGMTTSNMLAFPLSAAAATVVPAVVGTINLAPGAMNTVGKRIRICGEATGTATAATIEDIQFQWDSVGQNTAGKGVLIGDLSVTNTLATTGHLDFCQDFETTVAAATATGGSINHVNGWITSSGVSLAATAGGGDTVTPGAIGSLNLADDARINIIYLHTTATDGAGWILQNLSVQVL